MSDVRLPSNLEIHFLARITAIADFFDAITTKRSYADVLSVEDAIHVMEKTRGTKLDPKLFDVFVKHAKVLFKKGKNHLQLAEDFDPCQPHQELPLEEVTHLKEAEDFGKIRVVDGLKPKKKAS